MCKASPVYCVQEFVCRPIVADGEDIHTKDACSADRLQLRLSVQGPANSRKYSTGPIDGVVPGPVCGVK